jgi:hypothetical protein
MVDEAGDLDRVKPFQMTRYISFLTRFGGRE